MPGARTLTFEPGNKVSTFVVRPDMSWQECLAIPRPLAVGSEGPGQVDILSVFHRAGASCIAFESSALKLADLDRYRRDLAEYIGATLVDERPSIQ